MRNYLLDRPIHIWLLSPKHSCHACQTWTWYSIGYLYYDDAENWENNGTEEIGLVTSTQAPHHNTHKYAYLRVLRCSEFDRWLDAIAIFIVWQSTNIFKIGMFCQLIYTRVTPLYLAPHMDALSRFYLESTSTHSMCNIQGIVCTSTWCTCLDYCQPMVIYDLDFYCCRFTQLLCKNIGWSRWWIVPLEENDSWGTCVQHWNVSLGLVFTKHGLVYWLTFALSTVRYTHALSLKSITSSNL